MRNEDDSSEGSHLSDLMESMETSGSNQIEQMKSRYESAKAAKTGTNCKCGYCGLDFPKISYQQAFCKRGKCKDRYHNTVNETRRIRAGIYS